MSVTLKDVAQKARVSLATASLALNQSSKVKVETMEKVNRIARELNYIPNARARALVKKATRIIGLVIPEVVNPFFAEIAHAVKDKVREEGYNIFLCSTDYMTSEEKRYINIFKSGQVDGAIFVCVGDMMKNNNQLIDELVYNHIPVVYVDRDGVDHQLIPVVKSDIKDGAYQAADYLIQLGHKRIGFMGQSYQRMEGYTEAMLSHQLEINDNYIFYNYLSIEGGFKVGKKIIEQQDRPTAIVSLNDEMAIGLIQSLSAGGIYVPADISVCGFDNLQISAFYNPPLTTINIPKKQMGKKAAEILLKMMNDEELEEADRYVVYPTELIIRKSTRGIIV